MLVPGALEGSHLLSHKAKRAAVESGPFELRTRNVGQPFERKLALHVLCMDMACIPKRLNFIRYLAQTMMKVLPIVNWRREPFSKSDALACSREAQSNSTVPAVIACTVPAWSSRNSRPCSSSPRPNPSRASTRTRCPRSASHAFNSSKIPATPVC